MDTELGVLLALLLKGSTGFEASSQAFLQDLLRTKAYPSRISWEGEEVKGEDSDLVKLLDELPSDFLSKAFSYLKGITQDLGKGFKIDDFLNSSNYKRITGRQRQRRDVEAVERIFANMLGLGEGTFFDPSKIIYRPVKILTGHFLPVYCVHFDGSEQRMISAGDDGLIRIWCLRTGFLVASLRGHTACICDLSIDPSNRYLASCSLDQTIRIWDLSNGAPLIFIQVDSPVLTIEFHPLSFEDGRFGILMASCQDGNLRLWSVDLRRRAVSDPPMKYYCKTLARDSIRLVTFSNSGTRIVTGATDGIIRLLKTPSRDEIIRAEPFAITQPYVYFLDDHEGYVNSVHFSKNGSEFLTAGWDGTVRLWSYSAEKHTWTSRCYSSLPYGPPMARRGRKVTMVSFARNDSLILAAINELFAVLVFDKASGALLHTLQSHHTSDIQILLCHPTMERVCVSAGYDGRAAFWDLQTGRLLGSYESHGTCKFLDGSFSPSGDCLALTDDVGRVSLLAFGVSPDGFAAAPDVQLLPSDWLEPVFDETHCPIDPIANRPSHLVPPRVTCGLERQLNPIQTAPEFFQPVLGDSWMGSAAQERQEAQLRLELEMETAQFAYELSTCPPGIIPKNSRSKKRRNVYGSDVEDLLDDATSLQITSAAAEEAQEPEEVLIVDRRVSGRTARVAPLNEEEAEEGEDVYNPSLERQSRHRRRAQQRSRLVEEKEAYGPVEWLTIDDRRYSPYLPQIYDVVAYFPEGHRTFLEKEKHARYHENLPVHVSTSGVSRRSQQSHLLAQIVDVQFYIDPDLSRPYCELALIPIDEAVFLAAPDAADLQADPASPERFALRYYDMADIPDFIILACRYTWSLGQEYQVSQLVRVLYGHDEAYAGKVIRTGPRRRSAWQCYTVEWLSLTDPPEDCSPWELEPVNEDDPSFQPYACAEAIPEAALRILSEGLRTAMEHRRAEFLCRPVDYRIFPDYLTTVPYPMHLDLILRRLENGFYRRMEAFLWDAQLITTDALLYNEAESAIVKDAAFVYQMLEALVRRCQRPSRHAQYVLPQIRPIVTSPSALSPHSPEHSPGTTSRSKRSRAPIMSDSEEEDEEHHRLSLRPSTRTQRHTLTANIPVDDGRRRSSRMR